MCGASEVSALSCTSAPNRQTELSEVVAVLKLKCKNCGEVLLEAEARWEAVARTGMCPNCSWFYDDEKEIEVQRITRDAKILAETRSLKIREIIIGSAATIGSMLGIAFFLAAGLATGTYIFVFGLEIGRAHV